MKNRGVRRDQEKRVKDKIKKVLISKKDFCKSACEPAEEPTDKVIGKQAAVHGAVCSCQMCGNPRRYAKGKGRITMQERRLKAI
jgi:hypothetical protein